MSFKRTFKESKPLQYLLLVSSFAIIYFIYYTRFSFSSSSTYTPEELNSLLQNKKSHLVTLKKTELTAQCLTRPFLDETHFHVRNWDLHGNAFVQNLEFIRLTSTNQHLASNMFSKIPIQAESFEMELTFHIHNLVAKHGLVGDGLAVWFLDKPSNIGEVFGVTNLFNGLGIMIDTYKNGKRGQFPYVNIMLGDGKTWYNKGTDGYETRLGGCTAKDILNPSKGQTKMRLIYMKNGYLSIDFNYNGKHEDWNNCVTLTNVQLPSIKYLGFSAETGQLFENADIIENKMFALYKPNGDFVESIDELNDLIREQNELDNEVGSLNKLEEMDIKSSQSQRPNGQRNRAFKKKLSTQRRRTISRLKNAEKRIKEQERKWRLETYGDENATFIKRMLWSLTTVVKIVLFVLIIVILIWFALIGFRIQKQIRRSKTKGLLD